MHANVVVTDVSFAEGPVWCPDGTLVITPGAVQRAEELWAHTARMRPSEAPEEVAEVA